MDLFAKDVAGTLDLVERLPLEGLPDRPKGATRLGVNVEFMDFERIAVEFTDLGFGQLFTASEYKQAFTVRLP